MDEIRCKRCQSADHVRNGIVRGFQRYRCQDCGCNFTLTPPRGKPEAMKALALLLYATGNMSFNGIGKLLGVSDVSVLRWVRDAARRVPEPSVPAGTTIVLFDEMWHFLKKSLENFGFGGRSIPLPAAPSPGYWVAVTTGPSVASSTGSEPRAGRSSPMNGRDITGSFPRINSSRAKI